MLDLSLWEIIVIAIACILFLKPEDMPEMLRTAGKVYRKIKKTVNEFTSILDIEDDAKSRVIRPKNKVLGLDGKYHEAYDVKEVFEEEKPEHQLEPQAEQKNE